MANIRELYEARENQPTHEKIAERAYELYQKDGEEFSPREYWLKAEAELKKVRSKDTPASPKNKADLDSNRSKKSPEISWQSSHPRHSGTDLHYLARRSTGKALRGNAKLESGHYGSPKCLV